MHLASKVEMKYFHQLSDGELAYVPMGGTTCLITPISRNGNRTLIAILSGSMSGYPLVHEVQGFRAASLSLGKDWVLEPLIDASIPSSIAHQETPGSVHFNEHGTILFLAPFSSELFNNGLALNLKTFEPGYITAVGFCTLRWRIWSTEEDMQKDGVKPLFEFDGNAKAEV